MLFSNVRYIFADVEIKSHMYGKYRRKRFLIFISLIINLNLYCMKKVLLSAVTICCFCAAPAQEAHIPFQSHQAVITSVSSNGNWAVGSTQGVGYFVDAKTEKLEVFEENGMFYDINTVSDSGIAGGSVTPDYDTQTACYITFDKGFVKLPVSENSGASSCAGSSNDGSFLAGNISLMEPYQGGEQSVQIPVIWYRNAQGEYDMHEFLPFNKIGYDKRLTQGAYVLGISGDGLTIFGRIIDGSGTVYLPVVWKRTSTQSRDWVYSELCTDYAFNKDMPCPEWPQYKPAEPDVTQYYSDEELAAYNEAMEIYQDSVAKASWTIPKEEREPYPTYNPEQHKADFFDISTPEGAERHNKYAEAYNTFLTEATAYQDSIALYNELKDGYVNEERFNIKNMSVSNNGKYMVTNTVSNSVIIDSSTEEVKPIDGSSGFFPTAVLDDGTVFLGQITYFPPLDRIAMVYSDGITMDFGDWVKERSEKAYNDLVKNFSDMHVGVVISNNAEGVTFGGFNQSASDFGYVGWVMNLNAYDDFTAGISGSEVSGNDLSITYNREADCIDISGEDNADVRIFSINGSCVCKASCVSGSVPVSSLENGAYVVEVKAGGKVLRKKIILQ